MNYTVSPKNKTLYSCRQMLTVFQTSFMLDTHTQPFNGPFSGTTRMSRYQKGKTNLDFTEA